MSSTYAEPIARLEACLGEIGQCDPVYRTTAEKQEVLAALSRAKARLEAELMEIADRADYQRLLGEEERARAVTRLRFRRRGDDTTSFTPRPPPDPHTSPP